MLRNKKNTRKKEFIAKTFLTAIFIAGFALFIGWMIYFGPGLNALNLSTTDLVLLVFATFRMGHLLSYDRVMEPLRSIFTNTIPDPTGEGETVEPKGEGLQLVIGQLMCCPICTGTWASALMVYSMYLFPAPARVFVTVMAVIGAAEILNAAGEMLSWSGQYARNASGSINQARKHKGHNETPQDYTIDEPEPESLAELRVSRAIFSELIK